MIIISNYQVEHSVKSMVIINKYPGEGSMRSVRDGHGGGWSRKINAWHLYTLMVYL
jgi:hypothetical protein